MARRTPNRIKAEEMAKYVDIWTDGDESNDARSQTIAELGILYALLDLADAIRTLKKP